MESHLNFNVHQKSRFQHITQHQTLQSLQWSPKQTILPMRIGTKRHLDLSTEVSYTEWVEESKNRQRQEIWKKCHSACTWPLEDHEVLQNTACKWKVLVHRYLQPVSLDWSVSTYFVAITWVDMGDDHGYRGDTTSRANDVLNQPWRHWRRRNGAKVPAWCYWAISLLLLSQLMEVNNWI